MVFLFGDIWLASCLCLRLWLHVTDQLRMQVVFTRSWPTTVWRQRRTFTEVDIRFVVWFRFLPYVRALNYSRNAFNRRLPPPPLLRNNNQFIYNPRSTMTHDRAVTNTAHRPERPGSYQHCSYTRMTGQLPTLLIDQNDRAVTNTAHRPERPGSYQHCS